LLATIHQTKKTSVRVAAKGAALKTFAGDPLEALRNAQNARLYGTFVRQFSLNCYALPVVIVLIQAVGTRPAGRGAMFCYTPYLVVGSVKTSRHLSNFVRIYSRAACRPMVESFVTGLLAWRGGQPGQVGNEAATAVFHQCRGSGSSPSFFFL
jgi:hypothetical protein